VSLTGYVTAEQKNTRLVKKCPRRNEWIVVYRRAPQNYVVLCNGNVLGLVTKFKHWYPELTGDKRFMGPMGDGSRWPQKTRAAAIDWILKHSRIEKETP
jgi:hypothetical protein